jgi:CheY-like chemotaxis protein
MSTILLVEDDEDYASVLARVCENAGYEVVVVTSITSALTILDSERQIDLILASQLQLSRDGPKTLPICSAAESYIPTASSSSSIIE